MHNQTSISFEHLLDWIEGRLSVEEARQLEQQMSNASPETHAQLRWLRSVAALRQHLVWELPPPQVCQPLIERFARFARKQKPGFFQQLQAMLTFDSALQPALAGARAVEMSQVRQLVYTSDKSAVVLNLEPRTIEPGTDLSGQLLLNQTDLQPSQFCGQLLQGSHEIGITMVDEWGEFGFEALPAGSYRLILSAGALEIYLPLFEITT